jgi:hypothetical protein
MHRQEAACALARVAGTSPLIREKRHALTQCAANIGDILHRLSGDRIAGCYQWRKPVNRHQGRIACRFKWWKPRLRIWTKPLDHGELQSGYGMT